MLGFVCDFDLSWYVNSFYVCLRPDIDDLDDDGNLLLKRYRKYGPEKNHRKE